MILVTKYKMIIFLVLCVSEILCSHEECGEITKGGDNSFPWNVGIYLENQNQLELVCFGSIIGSNAVLTAAHCFCENIGNNLRNTTFYVTKNIAKKNVDLKKIPTNFYKINKNEIFIHKYYSGFNALLLNDIGIIKRKFEWNNKTKPVCVDWPDEIVDDGSTSKQPIWHNNEVKIIKQSYLDSEECTFSAPEKFLPLISEDKSCIINEKGIHQVHASEGAGLVFVNPENKRWYIKGVISMHDPSEGKISTYTTVKQNINWISNIVASL